MPDPNNYFIEEHDIVFQMICKAANTSMKWMLIDMFVAEKNQKKIIASHPNKKWKMLHKNEFSNSSLVIGFCRHPLDRIISCWKDKINGPKFHQGFNKYSNFFYHQMPFDDFVQNIIKIPKEKADQHFRLQTFDLNIDRIDHLVRFENIENDWNTARKMIKDHCGVTYPAMYHKNGSKKQSMKISSKSIKLIEEYYKDDYKILNYEN